MKLNKLIIFAAAFILSTSQSFSATASWYGDRFHGRKTASGETYDKNKMTCAHKVLPFGTIIMVENVHNGRKAKCRVNDRGPFIKGRVIDVSHAVAKRLKMISRGVIRVRLTVVRR